MVTMSRAGVSEAGLIGASQRSFVSGNETTIPNPSQFGMFVPFAIKPYSWGRAVNLSSIDRDATITRAFDGPKAQQQ
jgi:hypothetical protein